MGRLFYCYNHLHLLDDIMNAFEGYGEGEL